VDQTQKYEHLQAVLRPLHRVAVAFSGGIDSALVLKAACDALGEENVLALFARSTLLKKREIARAIQWPQVNGYSPGLLLDVVDVHPLGWKDFVNNGVERCYACKLHIYKLFFEQMERHGISVLLDGTNTDDLKTHRPGLRAIHELGVKTPLVEVGIDKADVRDLGRLLGLSNWDHPSSSCLATRIPNGIKINEAKLRLVERCESELERCGLTNCRVRLMDEDAMTLVLAVGDAEFVKMLSAGFRSLIVRLLKQDGVTKVLLDLESR
jgi:uncharacterized protein